MSALGLPQLNNWRSLRTQFRACAAYTCQNNSIMRVCWRSVINFCQLGILPKTCFMEMIFVPCYFRFLCIKLFFLSPATSPSKKNISKTGLRLKSLHEWRLILEPNRSYSTKCASSSNRKFSIKCTHRTINRHWELSLLLQGRNHNHTHRAPFFQHTGTLTNSVEQKS